VDGTGILLGSDGRSLGRVTDRMSMSVGRSQRLVAGGSSMWAVFYAPTLRAA
jgi:hypothetical protein